MRPPFRWIAVLALLFISTAAQAAHHSWTITEAYSNASGSTQFVELSCPNNGESGLGPFTLTSTTHTLNFVTNLPSATTQNTWVLCATSNFSSLPGAHSRSVSVANSLAMGASVFCKQRTPSPIRSST